MTNLQPDDCLEYGHTEVPCSGPVEYHSIDPGRERAHPRCRAHWEQRLARYENSIERYAHSDVAPPWFDPTLAGERWDDDY